MMTPFYKKIISTLKEQNWNDFSNTFKNVNSLLEDINSNRISLREELKSHQIAERLNISKLSKEVSTHFKWQIYTDEDFGFSIWINEYKSKMLRRKGYAQVPHNHRYWFSSLILNGGFDNQIYDVERQQKTPSKYEEIITRNIVKYSTGNIYSLTNEDIHSLTNIQDSTITLLIKSCGLKPYSEEFSLSSNDIIRHYTLPSKVEKQYPFIEKF